MRKPIIALFLLLLSELSYSQYKSFSIKVGPEVLLPAYTSSFGNNHTYGIGVEINAVKNFSKHFSYKLSSGFQHFTGKIETFNTESINYNLIPLLISLRYSYNPAFIGLETGPLVSINKSVSTHNTFSPCIGINLNKLEIEGRLINVLGMPSIPENSFLVRGGYGMYAVKVAYTIYYKNH
jgi:hypothetical protein